MSPHLNIQGKEYFLDNEDFDSILKQLKDLYSLVIIQGRIHKEDVPEDVVKEIRQDTLRQVLIPENEVVEIDSMFGGLATTYNKRLINKAKEIWGIDLSKD